MSPKDKITPPMEYSQGKLNALLHSVGPEYIDEESATIERRRETFKHACNNASDKVSTLATHLLGLHGSANTLVKLATKRGRDQHLGLLATPKNLAATVIMRYSPPKIRPLVAIVYAAATPAYIIVREGPQVLSEVKEAKAALGELSLATLGRLGYFTIAKKEMKLLQGTPA